MGDRHVAGKDERAGATDIDRVVGAKPSLVPVVDSIDLADAEPVTVVTVGSASSARDDP